MHHKRSVNLSKISVIVEQSESLRKPQLQSIKTDLRRQKQQETETAIQEIRESRSPPKQRMMDLLGEKGSLSWLSVLPLKDQGFNLNKGEFRDALNLRYGWQMINVPHHCKCGKAFSTDHAMTCPSGELPIARHNEIRDITAQCLTEVCTDVEKEPQLQSLSCEIILPRKANKQDDARLDIRAKGYWS